tara:strand:- start:1581 stop:1844 length:264 start_codon:yes stop_codon:yes gene_type:complete
MKPSKLAAIIDNDNKRRAIAYGESLLNLGRLELGKVIFYVRREILTREGYPAISHEKLYKALMGSSNLNEKGRKEVARVEFYRFKKD